MANENDNNQQPLISSKEQMDAEIIRRIKIMEKPDYNPGPPMNKVDFIGEFILAVVCIIIMFIGYFA